MLAAFMHVDSDTARNLTEHEGETKNSQGGFGMVAYAKVLICQCMNYLECGINDHLGRTILDDLGAQVYIHVVIGRFHFLEYNCHYYYYYYYH